MEGGNPFVLKPNQVAANQGVECPELEPRLHPLGNEEVGEPVRSPLVLLATGPTCHRILPVWLPAALGLFPKMIPGEGGSMGWKSVMGL